MRTLAIGLAHWDGRFFEKKRPLFVHIYWRATILGSQRCFEDIPRRGTEALKKVQTSPFAPAFCSDFMRKRLFFGLPAVEVDFDQTSEAKKAKRPVKSARFLASSVVEGCPF